MATNSSSPQCLCSIYSTLKVCLKLKVSIINMTTFTFANILFLLPLHVFILYLAFQRRRRPGTTASHSDVFTYHAVGIELLSLFGAALMCCGVFADLPLVTSAAIYLFCINMCGQVLFHVVTCGERYLAVVHPVTYRSWREARGIRIRNVAAPCVWLLSFAWSSVIFVKDAQSVTAFSIFVLVLALTFISFCSGSVLYALIGPGPGEGGGARQRVDQSKLRAFYTITVILGVLLVRFGGNLITTGFFSSPEQGLAEKCTMWFSVLWLSPPSSLVLPLLFLHRAGKLLCCTKDATAAEPSDEFRRK
ncbi:uncharacterized protein V6R79_013292 [Siganus canaliculatus]